MAMETNAAGVNNISPVERTQPISNNSTVSNKKIGDQASSPFQPETHVTIENSVADMLNVLSKAATETTDGTQKIPAELQKFINTLLQNSFSIDSSLAEGLGSVLQSQRFTLDQLNIVAKILNQMGNLAEMDQSNILSDDLKTLLSNLTQLDGTNGKTLNSVNLMKMAFQLLEGKSIEDVPAQLQLLLGNDSSSMPALPQQETESLGFLKQLIKMFLPAPSDTTTLPKNLSMNTSSQTQQNMGPSNMPSASVSTTLSQQKLGMGSLEPENQTPTTNTKQLMPHEGTQGNTPQTATQSLASATYAMQKKFGTVNEDLLNMMTLQEPIEDSVTESMDKQNGDNKQNNQSDANPQSTASSVSQQNSGTRTLSIDMLNQTISSKTDPKLVLANASTTALTENEVVQAQPNNQAAVKPELQNSSESVLKQSNPNIMRQFISSAAVNPQKLSQFLASPVENTEQTMQTMKNLANQLMNTSSLDGKSLTLLKNFVNGKQEIMPEQDAKQLQLLLRLSENNIPTSISQAAIKQNLPELPKLWTFVQLCDLSELKDMQANELKNASKNMNDFASLLRKSMGNENSISENHRSMAFMTPLYLGENQKNYPTYVHIYDQSENKTGQNNEKKETWLRLCLLTENIGAVEMVFRLYEKENLNVRISFSNNSMVESFNQYIPELKASFENYPLVVKDFKVRAIGE
jgi:translation initiation factor 2 beta subunit (eIF-2beta)/eIF-5